MSAENSRSMTWSSSSLVPSKPTMEWPSGITIRIVEPGLSPRVSVNSLLSARRPGHRAAAEDVRVHVPHGLPAVLAGVEDDPVPGGLDALGIRDLPCHGDQLVEQPVARGRQRRYVREVVPRYHKDVRRRLRIEVTEGDAPLPVHHEGGRDMSGSDTAEQAVWHTSIITGGGRARCQTAQRADAVRHRAAKIIIARRQVVASGRAPPINRKYP